MVAYHINVDHAFVLFRPTGQFTECDLINLIQAVFDDPRRSPTFTHVWDTRAIDKLVMDADVISMYRNLIDENVDRIPEEKVAVVASRAVTRTFASMLIQVSKEHPATFQLFERLEGAADWIGVPPAALTTVADDTWTEV
jgi:hypothetical protein